MVACTSDRTRLDIHTTCTNRRARGPALEQWDHHAATILQGQSVGGKPLSRRPTVRGPMLKKDNRPLIYDLGSLVRSPSTFFLSLSLSLTSLSVYLSFYHLFPLSRSSSSLSFGWPPRSNTRYLNTRGSSKILGPSTRSHSIGHRLFGYEARPTNFSRRIFRPTHKFRDSIICTITCSSQALQLAGGPCKIDCKEDDFRHGFEQGCSV